MEQPASAISMILQSRTDLPYIYVIPDLELTHKF